MSRKFNVKVAICIPYYQKFKCLVRLIESIKKQTFKEYVVIVTDDSMDIAAENYIKSLGNQYVYFKNEMKKGPTANCNYAMKCGRQYKPDYIKVMHHDDYFSYDNSLEIMVKALDDDSKAVLVFSDTIQVEAEIYERHVTEKQIAEVRQDLYNLFDNNIFSAPSATLVRNCNIYMDENLVWIVDWEWYIKLLESQNHFVHIDQALISIGVDSDRVTDYCHKHKDLIEREHIYAYVKHYQLHRSELFDRIISKCLRNYDGVPESGFYCKGDYRAILRDAMQDGRKFCLWIGDLYSCEVEKKLGLYGIEVEYFYLENREVKFTKQSKKAISIGEMADLAILCIICKKWAKETRKMLNEQGINAIPLIEKYL